MQPHSIFQRVLVPVIEVIILTIHLLIASVAVSKALNNPGFSTNAYKFEYSNITTKTTNLKPSSSLRPSTAIHPNSKTSFRVGYNKETGKMSSQMMANKEITDTIAPENHTEMKTIHDRYRKRQGKSTLNIGKKPEMTSCRIDFKTFDNSKGTAGIYKPKVEVQRKSMESHMSSKFSIMSTS